MSRTALRCRVVEHAAPGRVRVVEAPVPVPGPGEVLVAARVSAISAGTELLLYRGAFPEDALLDETLPALRRRFEWPVRYGYAAVGTVVAAGDDEGRELVGRDVFAFHPHGSHFVAATQDVLPLSAGLDPETAALLPAMETALALVMDARPVPGERVLVAGLGVVGLLTTALLARMPLALLVVADRWPARRAAALEFGAKAAVEDLEPGLLGQIFGAGPEHGGAGAGADLALELTGDPAALDGVIRATGSEGRVVVGSWYGTRRAALDLGTHFHRARITLRSSQVSALDPALRGRWTHERRLRFALELLRRLRPARLVTHRFPVEDAAAAFRLLDTSPGEAVQVLLTYDAGDPCTGSA